MDIIQTVNTLHYRRRGLEQTLEQALKDHPVVVLVGARQTGKTTLVQRLPSASGRVFRSLDDMDVLELAKRRPEDLLGLGSKLSLDEVQRAPEILLAVKRDVDKRRQRGRFLLTGSASLLLMHKVSESLSGRAVYLNMQPFTCREKQGSGEVPPWSNVLAADDPDHVLRALEGVKPATVNWRREALIGGMPRSVLARSARERAAWFEGYLRTYLERDLRDLSAVESLPDFRRLMSLAAERIGEPLNQSNVGNKAGLSQPTTHRYLNLLEISFQIHRLAPFNVSRAKRLVRSPKLYWGDPGLAAHLVGVASASELMAHRLAGAFLENLVLVGLLAWRESTMSRPEVLFWRTSTGIEVDFLIEQGRRLVPIEVKSSPRVRWEDVRHLDAFLEEHENRAPFGIVLYDGRKPERVTRRIVALPVTFFL